MTTISEIGAPIIDPADRRPPATRKHFPASLMAWMLAAIVTAVNASAVVYLSSAIGELRAIDQRLEHLEAFEERIAGRLDAMNVGVQNRLEILSGEVHGQFNRVDTALGKLETKTGGIETATGEIGGLSDPSSAFVPPEEALAGPEPSAKIAKEQTAKGTTPAYERVQAAEGKGYYRKLDRN